MNKLNYEILSAIDNIETTVMESEMNVMNSIIDSYDKVVMILENCDDNVDTSSFEIFQESVIMEADNNGNKKSVKEIILDILLFIPRMIVKLMASYIKFCVNVSTELTKKILTIRLAFNFLEKFLLGESSLPKIIQNDYNNFGIFRVEYEWINDNCGVKIVRNNVTLNDDNALVKMVRNVFNKNKNRVKQTELPKQIKSTTPEPINDNVSIIFDDNKKDIDVECLSFFNIVTYYKGLSNIINNLINNIDSNKMLKDEEYSKDLFDKLHGIINDLGDEPKPETKNFSIKSYEKYVGACKNGFDDVATNFNKCQDKMNTIAESIKNIPDDEAQSVLNDNNSPIMKSVMAIQELFSKIIDNLKIVFHMFKQSIEMVNVSIDSINETVSSLSAKDD